MTTETAIPVIVPLFNVNDETVAVSHWMVEDGDHVEAGQVLASVETSKASVEIEAPASGFVHMRAGIGAEVAVGKAICYLTDSAQAGALPPAAAPANGSDSRFEAGPDAPLRRVTPVAKKLMDAHGLEPDHFAGRSKIRKDDVLDRLQAPRESAEEEVPASGPTRFSTRALALLRERGLSPEAFVNAGLVREADVLRAIDPTAAAETRSTPAPSAGAESAGVETASSLAAAGVAFTASPLPRRKRIEAKYLQEGGANTLASTIVVACPTRGLRAAIREQEQIQGNATVLFLYEVSRLLADFPLLNAFYADGGANVYDEVNIGFAVDGGLGLKVPVIRQANKKSAVDIAIEIQDRIMDYLSESLSVEAIYGGTFTITDLSGEGVFTFNPLINRGQSAILGIGGEFFPPGSAEGMFNLILAFDHRITEGRQAAKFLGALAARIRNYEGPAVDSPRPAAVSEQAAAVRPAAIVLPQDLSCSRCLRTFEDLKALSAFLLPNVKGDGTTNLICSLCLRGF
jgi:pyruvate/2-oxoglutarate dehydrogenase complex dihydrolipoamide acyltransferase (E2) component